MDVQQADALRKPFPANAIGKLPRGGVQLDYVGHAAVTDRLLAVDPEWSWEPFAVDERGLPALDGSNNLWIRLTVCGVTRIGVGDGNSAKEVIGDAIRNAAMRFGVALDLWGKEELEQSGGPAHAATPQDAPTPPPSRTMSRSAAVEDALGQGIITARQTGALHAAFNDAGMSDREVRLNYCRKLIGRDIESSKELTRAEASKVLDALKTDAAEPATDGALFQDAS